MSQETPIKITSKEQFNKLLTTSKIVVADFWADWCGPCKQIAPLYDTLAKSLSRPNLVTFVKIDSDKHVELSQQYKVTGLPSFLVFRDGKEERRVQGANPHELKAVAEALASEVGSLAESSGRAGQWKGADIPRGYSDINDQIEIRGLEVLNADEDAGTVRELFENTKPTGLGNGKVTKKDYVQSGSDDQLLLYIPFQSSVKLHTLQLTSCSPEGDDDDEIPARPGMIHLYINRPHNMDFNEAETTDPTQAIELGPNDWNADGTANISLRYVKFQKTTTLIIFIQRGDGEAETVRLDRIKLIGEAGPKREMGKLQKVGEDE